MSNHHLHNIYLNTLYIYTHSIRVRYFIIINFFISPRFHLEQLYIHINNPTIVYTDTVCVRNNIYIMLYFAAEVYTA